MVGTFALVLLTITGLVLSFVILLQRGRGGGLAGALGGAGGQSAFGTKAGDVLTRITIGIALVWVLLFCTALFADSPTTKYHRDHTVTMQTLTIPALATSPSRHVINTLCE